MEELVPKDATNAFLVFQRGDGIDTYYKINSVKVFIDEATIGRVIEANSGIDLVGFAQTQRLSPNIFDFVPPTTGDNPVPIEPPEAAPEPQTEPELPPTPEGTVRLNINGYEGVSDIFLADDSLKIKDDSRLNIQLATHSISLGEDIGDRRSNVDYEITDLSGKLWVKVVQKETTREGRLGGLYGNNHPDKQYLSGLNEDCNIYLPMNRNYKIRAISKGNMAVDFWVHHPWSDNGQERRLHRSDLGISGESTYTLHSSDLRDMSSFQRVVKININGKM
jgi:hypothetical protein